MPHTNTWEKKGLLRKFTGNIQPEEILSSNFDIHVHPEFESIKYIINDFTEVTGMSVNKSHTKIYASSDDMASNTKGKLKIAIIAIQDAHIALANNYREEMKDKLFNARYLKL